MKPFSQWIKVADKLPEVRAQSFGHPQSGDVLATDGEVMDFAAFYQRKDGTTFWSSRDGYFAKNQPTHWMPLPDLPDDKSHMTETGGLYLSKHCADLLKRAILSSGSTQLGGLPCINRLRDFKDAIYEESGIEFPEYI